MGCVEANQGRYCCKIQGKFAARGPPRKTHAEARRDGNAIAKAKDREQARKILTDLKVKDLRVKASLLLLRKIMRDWKPRRRPRETKTKALKPRKGKESSKVKVMAEPKEFMSRVIGCVRKDKKRDLRLCD